MKSNNKLVKWIRMDNAGGDVNEFKDMCETEFGITPELTPPNTPHMNGVVE